MLVDIRHRGSAYHLDPQMRELAFAAAQPLLNLAQAVGPSQFTEQHRDELLPAAYSSGMPLGFKLANLALEIRPRNKLENLAG